jgi:hypothetical protein
MQAAAAAAGDAGAPTWTCDASVGACTYRNSHMPLFLLNKSPANRLPQSRMAGSADGCSNASLAKQRLQEREWCSCLDATTASLHFFLIVVG